MTSKKYDRRDFLKLGAGVGGGLALGGVGLSGCAGLVKEEPAIAKSAPLDTVRVGIVGTGGRGNSLMSYLLKLKNVEIRALCDIVPEKVAATQARVVEAGQAKPDGYDKGPEDFKRLMDSNDLDTVIITTPWEWHTPMAVYGMKAGKYVGSEVPAAMTIEECWELIDTFESTGVPCMMLENWAHRRDNLAVLNMIRKGLLGEIVHCHCAHSHNCVFWYVGAAKWSQKHLIEKNGDQYPTHSLGPVLSWMNINCGDRFDYVTSMATRSLGINDQLARSEDYGPDHPATKRKYAQGDIVTTMVKTVKGNTIVIANDMQLPRPYDNRWMIQGTRGIYNEQRHAVYLEGLSPKREAWEPLGPYQDKYDHAWYRASQGGVDMADQLKGGHGDTDYTELREFIKAVRNRTQTPIDIYDSVTFSVIIPLSMESIARGSAPVKCPDFTRGRWKTRKPTFAVDM